MKRLIFLPLLLVLMVSLVAGTENSMPEGITPEGATLFLKSASINEFIDASKDYMDNYLTGEQKKNALARRDEFKEMTGIDFLDKESFRSKHIDTDRPVAFAYLPKKQGKEQMIIYVPVLDEKKFPLAFIDIVKKSRKYNSEKYKGKNAEKSKAKTDIEPVITPYKDTRIYQLEKDVFLSAAGGYCSITSSGELARDMIDRATGNSSGLAVDERYTDFIQKMKNKMIFSVFLKREFLQEIYPYRPSPNKKMFSPFEMIDYASAGLAYDSKHTRLNMGASFNQSNNTVALLLTMLRTGMVGRSVCSEDVSSYSFFSLDLKQLIKKGRKGDVLFDQYQKIRKETRKELGIDLSSDFIPYYSGVTSTIVSAEMNEKGVAEMIAFLPMDSASRTRSVWNKMRRHLKKKYSAEKKFGQKRIEGDSSFWVTNSRETSFYVLYNKKGLWLSNSEKLLSQRAKYVELSSDTPEGIAPYLNDSLFFLAFIKESSFIHNLLKTQAARDPRTGDVAGAIGTIFWTGNRQDNYVSIDMDINLIPGKK